MNIKGVYLVAQAVGHEMVKAGGGVIINMSAESGLEGSEGQRIYAALRLRICTKAKPARKLLRLDVAANLVKLLIQSCFLPAIESLTSTA